MRISTRVKTFEWRKPVAVVLAALATWGSCRQSALRAEMSANQTTSKRDGHLQSVCGPRCVRRVLQYFGRDAELVDLIREMQDGDVERPSSLEAVSVALEKRGVRSFAMRIASDAVLRWRYPVVVHLDGKATPGHFAVWLPTSTSHATEVWMGLALVETMSAREFGRRRSGAVLLTSDEPITDPGDSVSSLRRVTAGALFYCGLSMAAVAAVLWRVVSLRRRRAGALGIPSTLVEE